MIDAKKEDMIVVERVPYIYYLVQFQKTGKKVTKVLINSSSEINAMTPLYVKQLDLQIW